MWDFQPGRAITLMMRTAPFLGIRLLIYFGITLAYILASGLGGGLGYVVGGRNEEALGYAFWGAVSGVGAVSGGIYFVREYLLYMVKAGHINPWAGARDGVVLYAQNYKNLLKNAIWLTVFVWILTFVVFLVMLSPAVAIAAVLPSQAAIWTVVIAVLLAWSVKAALIDPIAMTCLMQAYFKAIEGQEPRAEWIEKLNGMSGKFKELGQKALQFTGVSGLKGKSAITPQSPSSIS